MPINFEPTTKKTLEKYEKERQNSFGIDTGKYNLTHHQYPIGLGEKSDLRHFVAFYINVREKSTERNPDAYNILNDVKILPTTRKITPDQLAEKLPEIVGVQTTLAALGITTISQLVESGLGRGTSKSKNARPGARAGGAAVVNSVIEGLKTIGKAGAFGAAAALVTNELLKIPILQKTTFLRLKEVINLHISERPTVKYGMNYTEADLGLLAGLIASGAAGIESVKEMINNPSEGLTPREGTAAILATLAKVPMAIGGGRATDILGATTGVRINPFREVLFESIDYRTFNFKYRFFPKSEDETIRIKNIIDTFKLHMHPDLSASNIFYIYPSEFEIVYYYKPEGQKTSVENQWMHRIGKCALTDMAIEYGGDSFSTFDNGAPTQINLTLTFRELEQLTKREMRQGY